MIQKLSPADETQWHALRGQDVTASVVGALFGVHPFATPYSLWAQKTGRLPVDAGDSPQLRRGRYMEIAAVQMLRDDNPLWDIEHNAAEMVYYRDPDLRLGATPDVIAYKPGWGYGVVQIKSVEASIYRRGWLDEEGQPEAPLWIALQAVLEAHLAGGKWAAVAPIVVGHGIDMPLIDIPLDHKDGVIASMAEKAAEFWKMVEEGAEPPVDYDRDSALIDRIYAEGDNGDAVDLTTDDRIGGLIELVNFHAERRSAHDDAVRAAKAEIKAIMGYATTAYLDGGRSITWRTEKRAGRYEPPSETRVLRLPRSTI